MQTGLQKFEINSDGITFNVERSLTDNNIYWLYSPYGTYMVARDYYKVWVELTRKKGSPDIHLTKIGQIIEDFSNERCTA